jgi:hypothetical protein
MLMERWNEQRMKKDEETKKESGLELLILPQSEKKLK